MAILIFSLIIAGIVTLPIGGELIAKREKKQKEASLKEHKNRFKN